MDTIFIGYTALEDLIPLFRLADPVCACLVSESGSGHVREERAIIEVAQPLGHEVRFVRIHVASVQWMGETPFTPDHEQRQERARAAYKIVRTWLEGRGFHVHEALVARPGDLKMLEGHADFLGWNKEDGYFLKE